MNPFNIQSFESSNQRQINLFYRKNSRTVSCNASDMISVAENEQKIVAVGFIRTFGESKKTQYRLLRSLFVSENFRGHSIGREITKHLCQRNELDTYTICEESLVDYYRSLGFHVTEPHNRLPSTWLKEIKKGLTLMVKPFSS